MTTLLAKTYVIAEVVSHRHNVQGDVYKVNTPEYQDVVIVDPTGCITCSCSGTQCSHILAVRRRRAVEALADARHAALAATFDLSYGDEDAA